VAALLLDKDDAQRLVDADEVGKPRLAVAPDAAERTGLPAAIGGERQVEQGCCLLVGELPQPEEIDRGAEHRRPFRIRYRIGAEFGSVGLYERYCHMA